MASFQKRQYSTRRVICDEDAGHNKTFDSEADARARAQQVLAIGHKKVTVKRLSSQGWQVRIRRKGLPTLVRTFARKDQGEQWAAEREGEIATRQFVDHRRADCTTLGDLLLRYGREKRAGRRGSDPDTSRIGALCRHRISNLPMSRLRKSHISAYRVSAAKP